MKNKRWKRKAKRIYGECTKYASCLNGCKYVDDCPIWQPVGYLDVFGIRDLESYFKGKRGGE